MARITAGAIVVVVGVAAVGLWPDRYKIALGRAPSEEIVGPLGLLFVVSLPCCSSGCSHRCLFRISR